MSERTGPLQDAQSFVHGLFDPRLVLSRGMLITMLRLGFVLAVVPPAILTVLAFERSGLIWGLVWLVVIGPAIYLGIVVALRLLLGFAAMILRLIEQLMRLPDAVDRLTEQVDSLRTDLGRSVDDLTGHVESLPASVGLLNEHIDSLQGSLDSAQFWRAGRRRRAAREAGAAEAAVVEASPGFTDPAANA